MTGGKRIGGDREASDTAIREMLEETSGARQSALSIFLLIAQGCFRDVAWRVACSFTRSASAFI